MSETRKIAAILVADIVGYEPGPGLAIAKQCLHPHSVQEVRRHVREMWALGSKRLKTITRIGGLTALVNPA
jgi:hypothetical protein